MIQLKQSSFWLLTSPPVYTGNRYLANERTPVKLRTQIFLLLFLLGLAPLLIAVAINVPLVLDKLERFYHEAHLEKLRTGFRDLDQHITRRQEIVRLFAKLPEPGIANGENRHPGQSLEEQRAAYVDWANGVLFDQQDITQVIFINRVGKVSFSMQRNFKTGKLESGDHNVDLPSPAFFSAGLKLSPGAVITSPISFNSEAGIDAPNRFMTLHFISPLISSPHQDGVPELDGVVVFNLDIGGLAHAYRGIYWAQNNGEYLASPDGQSPDSTAFSDFPGLEKLFRKGNLALWEKGSQQVFWLPLFPTQGSGPLWVGRSVDPSPLTEFRHTLEIRVAAVVTGMLLVVFLIARFIAVRTERISQELTDGIGKALEQSQPVQFSWQRPQELRSLGENLTSLAEKHASDTQALRTYAHDLEESNLYKSQFLANVSHELRTPLNSILLLSKLLANSKDDMPAQHTRQAQVIHAAGKDLRVLIDTILDLSRIEAGKAALKVEQIDLPVLLEDLRDLMQPQFDEKGLKLKLEISADAPASIVSDTEKLRQILVNFLSNALKFTDQGGATLKLAANDIIDTVSCPLAISVSDSGIGIPRDKHALVFEAFKQVDGSTSRRYGGTGLGLTISRELASLVNGHIDIRSETGRGSTFTLLLPFSIHEPAPAKDTPDATDQVGPEEHGIDIPEADYGGSRVLLVDDDLRNLLALTPLLNQWGIEVVAAGDGREALDTLEEDSRFSLILMDLMMPELDGFEAMRKIRKNSAWSSLPIVALTARAAEEDRRQAIASGASDYLSKPVEASQLKAVLDRYLATAGKA